MNIENFPLVSIIIPYYNHNKFITKTLDSILDDTYPNKEIILINDGSTEENDHAIINWIEQYKNDILITYIKRENKGLTKTLNELIRTAEGQYLALLGSDDYFINDTLAERVKLLQNNPSKLMVIGDAIVVDGVGNTTHESGNFGFHHGNKENYFTDKGLKREIIRNWSVVGPVAMMHKSIFDLIGNYDEDLLVEDWDFYLRAVAKDLIIFLDQKVAAYRVHGDNTISNPKTLIKFRHSIMISAKQNLKLFPFPYKYWLWKQYRSNQRKYRKLLKRQ
jgi:alpha-1,3-rhamnosyltransferase